MKYRMEFRELDEIIKNSDYPRKDFLAPLTLTYGDSFRIKSIMYNHDIDLNSLSSLDELYKKIEDYNLSKELFNQPYYLIVSLEDFNDNTIEILNKLDNDVIVQLATNKDIGPKEKEFLSKIKKENVYFYNNNWINLENMNFVLSKFKVDSESSPVLIIDKIDSSTVKFINECALKYPKLRYRVELKDYSSIQNLNMILPFMSGEEIVFNLDDNLFSDKNPQNIRNLILPKSSNVELNVPSGKKILFMYNGILYDELNDVFDLERYIEILKSHIPSGASELDKVAYVSLFEANYFTYDYEEYENSINHGEAHLISLTEFITSKKGVCRDYAAFTKYLLNSLSVECEVLETGIDFYYEHGMDEGHAFNLIRINGKEYFLDNTWLAETMKSNQIHTLAESPNFLSSGADFQHEGYETVLDGYNCETMDRDLVRQSESNVLNWNKNYFIHPQAIKDLFRKHIIKKQMTVEEQIESAIPSRRR